MSALSTQSDSLEMIREPAERSAVALEEGASSHSNRGTIDHRIEDIQDQLRSFHYSVEFQLWMLSVTMLDVSMCTADIFLATGRVMGPVVFWCTVFALTMYGLELFILASGTGMRNFSRNPWNIVDLAIVSLSAVFIENANGDVSVNSEVGRPVFLDGLFRVLRILRILRRLCIAKIKLTIRAQHQVSKNKHRYVDHVKNYDLDLTKIHDNLIAMGVPACGLLTYYRNPRSEVARFFNTEYQDHYRIYNICPELPYPEKPFNFEVVRINVQDHTPPSMDAFVDFLKDSRAFLERDRDNNVVAVHCKAGKGRTGSLCAGWLMYNKICPDSQSALHCFADRRTAPSLNSSRDRRLCGVETPSQVRYVHQLYEHLKRGDSWFDSPQLPLYPGKPPITLHSLRFHEDLFLQADEMFRIKVLIQCGGTHIDELVLETNSFDPTRPEIKLESVVVAGDVRISVFEEKFDGFSAYEAMRSVSNAMNAKGLVLMFLFHTDFVDMLGLSSLKSEWASNALSSTTSPLIKNAKGASESKSGQCADTADGRGAKRSRRSIFGSGRNRSSVLGDNNEDEAKVLPGMKKAHVRVQELDKAHKKVSKGKHGAHSSVTLCYHDGGHMPLKQEDQSKQVVALGEEVEKLKTRILRQEERLALLEAGRG